MHKSTKEKIDVIINWYRISGQNMSLEKNLELLRTWKAICIEHEEYEIAAELRLERARLLRAVRIFKYGKRTRVQKIVLKTKILIRKLKRLIDR